MARSKHGTAMNDSSEQTRSQREAYGDRFSIGRNKRLGVKSEISNFGGETPERIMREAINIFKSFDYTSGANPDFYQDLDLTTFSDGNDKFDEALNQYDKPNLFGPNIKAININNPEVAPDGHTSVSSPTFVSSGSAGFGVSIDRNNPQNPGINKSYLGRRGTNIIDGNYKRGSRNKLGEYIDGPVSNDPYEYIEDTE